jgi:hypothetical protein
MNIKVMMEGKSITSYVPKYKTRKARVKYSGVKEPTENEKRVRQSSSETLFYLIIENLYKIVVMLNDSSP